MNFTAEYQFTFEEYKEAMTHISKSVRVLVGAKRGVFGWILFLALAVMLFIVLEKQGGSPRPVRVAPLPTSPPNPFNVFLPAVPWLLVFGFIWFFIFRRIRGQYQNFWDQNPLLHRVRRITITDHGLVQSDATFESRTNWAHYMRLVETPNLFLLFISNNSAELVPKRIFTSPGDLDQIRSLLERNISGQVGGFPVIPLSPIWAEGDQNGVR